VILALTEVRNNPPLANLVPVVIGLLVVGIGMAWGTDAGYAINPARDFGPRLASLFTGYGDAMSDQYGNLYFWVPIIAPIIGGLVGAGLWRLLVHRYIPEEPLPSAPIDENIHPAPERI
jgi:glycerol uptake facilitator protein